MCTLHVCIAVPGASVVVLCNNMKYLACVYSSPWNRCSSMCATVCNTSHMCIVVFRARVVIVAVVVVVVVCNVCNRLHVRIV